LPPDREESHFEQLGLNNVVRHQDGDIRDLDGLLDFFQAVQPEIVFHLAAQALVGRSYANPHLTFSTNVGGSLNVLEAIRLTK
jgi:CDP-glucose 4,6-dehydratase